MAGKTIAVVIAVLVVAGAAYFYWPNLTQAPTVTKEDTMPAQEETTVVARLSGVWQSTTDTKFTREIRQDGVMIDRYEGEPTAGLNGEWSVANPEQESMIADLAASLSGVSVIKVSWEGGVETTYFSVNTIDATSMTTTDLTGRGEVTIWKKL